ncbi:hypothetical protein D584_20742 [Brucella intermedia M86]|uniref:Uncharacterized protein n=1 Tax=Brucella intermedia M86 TaxID=1234597 RepID=M5JL48_9HYPH|nr:hypothetical protein D584_20742 [Brucella intermedia M86]
MFAACDEVYFRKHGKGFCKSGLASGHSVHVTVSPEPGPGLVERAKDLSSRLLPKFLSSFTASELERLTVEVVADKRAKADIRDIERVVFYQSLRFFCLPDLLRKYQRPIVVLDIDSLIRAPIPVKDNADLGLFLRLDIKGRNEEERLGMMVLGAMVYASPSGISFFEKVISYLDTHERRYYVDQRALYETYQADRELLIFDIAEMGWLDWTFGHSSPVWTAKGKRKRRNLQYVRERMKFEGRSLMASALILAGYRLGLLRT